MQRERPALQLLESLRSIAALPLEKIEALELRGFAWRMRDSLVDAPDMPSFKEDVVAFRIFGVGIAFQDQHCWSPTSARAERKARKLKGAPTGVAFTETKLAFQTYSEP